MPLKKTTKAVIKSARLNPVTSERDRAVLELIEQGAADGYTFKDIVIDAILYANGKTPDNFDRPQSNDILSGMEDLLSRFADEIVREVKNGGSVGDATFNEPEASTNFSRNLAKTFMQRQQQNKGDE